MDSTLFGDFDKQSGSAWREKIITDLIGKPYDLLEWESQGINGKPFYTEEGLSQPLGDFKNIHKSPQKFGLRNWTNYQILEAHSANANKNALEALNTGANGLLFKANKTPPFELLLKDVNPKYCHISFVLSDLEIDSFIEAYSNYLDKQKIELAEVHGFIQTTESKIQTSTPNIRCFTLSADSKEWTKDLELVLQNTGNPVAVFDQLCLTRTLSKDHFYEIAFHRALRGAVVKLGQKHGISLTNNEVEIVSFTPDWSGERKDIHNAILEATTMSMAAAVAQTVFL